MSKKISYKKNLRLIEKDEKRYLCKVKRNDKTELFNYLRLKNFSNFLQPSEINDTYEVYPYINEVSIPIEDKAIELINTLSMLHIKTTTYQEVNQEQVSELYEKIKEQINYLGNYYLDLQDYIETKEFMSPAEYILMLNISKFHKAIDYSNRKLEQWYKLKKNTLKERVVQLHQNISLDHFLIEDYAYLISWDKSKKDLVIYDFLNFYRNEYQNLEMTSLFELYQSKYEYTEDEFLLFKCLIAIPQKITFKKENIINVIEARKIIDYVEKTNKFLSKYYEENQETH